MKAWVVFFRPEAGEPWGFHSMYYSIEEVQGFLTRMAEIPNAYQFVWGEIGLPN